MGRERQLGMNVGARAMKVGQGGKSKSPKSPETNTGTPYSKISGYVHPTGAHASTHG